MKNSREVYGATILVLIFVALGGGGCYEELPLIPTEGPEPNVTLTEAWESPVTKSHTLHSIWVDGQTGAIFCTGEFGTIVRIGAGETRVDVPIESALYGIWGTNRSDVYACGWGGLIFRSVDDTTWERMESPTNETLLDIWGYSESNIYAVGTGGTILHYDGNAWTAVSSGVTTTIYSIWGSSPERIHAVGAKGVILDYDGAAWTPDTGVTTATLRSVWGWGEDTVYAVGDSGKVVYRHERDGEWKARLDSEIDSTSNLTCVWGTSSEDLYAGSGEGRILRLLPYSPWWRPSKIVPDGVLSMDGVSADLYYVCGVNGSVYRIEPDAGRRILPSRGTTASLLTVWGRDDLTIFVAGIDGTVLARQGEGWRIMQQPDESTIWELWGANNNAVFAAAGNRILRFDGHIWSVAYRASADWANFVTIWGRSAYDVYAAGDSGRVIHFDGGSWTPMETGTDKDIGVIRGRTDGNVYTAGQGGIIMEYDGSTWRKIFSKGNFDFYGLLVRGSNSILAVGDSGCVVQYDGTSWKGTSSVTGGAYSLLDCWGFRSDELFAVGEHGVIMYFDGDNWFKLNSNTVQELYGIWGVDRNRFFAVGSGGTIIRYDVTYID